MLAVCKRMFLCKRSEYTGEACQYNRAYHDLYSYRAGHKYSEDVLNQLVLDQLKRCPDEVQTNCRRPHQTYLHQ